MKKEKLLKMRMPISQKDFQALKRAFDLELIEREELDDKVRDEMDRMWSADLDRIYDEKIADGTFGAFD